MSGAANHIKSVAMRHKQFNPVGTLTFYTSGVDSLSGHHWVSPLWEFNEQTDFRLVSVTVLFLTKLNLHVYSGCSFSDQHANISLTHIPVNQV